VSGSETTNQVTITGETDSAFFRLVEP
jgi:hypothetical protein